MQVFDYFPLLLPQSSRGTQDHCALSASHIREAQQTLCIQVGRGQGIKEEEKRRRTDKTWKGKKEHKRAAATGYLSTLPCKPIGGRCTIVVFVPLACMILYELYTCISICRGGCVGL